MPGILLLLKKLLNAQVGGYISDNLDENLKILMNYKTCNLFQRFGNKLSPYPSSNIFIKLKIIGGW
jgi:hypothetical protein